MASKARPAASAPCGRETTGEFVRSPQMRNCSMAAARNVSPGAERQALALGRELGGELADRGRLARSVDPHHQHHEGLLRRIDHEGDRDRRQDAFHLARQDGLDLLGVDALLVAAAAQSPGDAGRHGEAEIGLDQHVLEVVERRGVELALGEDADDPVLDRRGGARQPSRQPGPPAARLRLLGRGGLRTLVSAAGVGRSRVERRRLSVTSAAAPARRWPVRVGSGSGTSRAVAAGIGSGAGTSGGRAVDRWQKARRRVGGSLLGRGNRFGDGNRFGLGRRPPPNSRLKNPGFFLSP